MIPNADPVLSFRDFTGQDLRGRMDLDFSDKVVYASCFSQEVVDREIFDADLRATFVRCNLSNVLLPTGCLAVDCNRTRFCIQNDLRDWEIDDKGQPIKVINEKFWMSHECSIEPEDIPDKRLSLDAAKGEDLMIKLREIKVAMDAAKGGE